MKPQVKRIAIIGPESSGKSMLCEQLAKHYKTNWVPEYAREYLPLLNRNYTITDIVKIYNTQFDRETKLISTSHKFIFTDTEFIIAKVWCENSFGNCPDTITQHIKETPYDFYLLTAPDLPWQPDVLRENPGKGEFFFEWYKRILIAENLNYGIVSGFGEKRFENALAHIEIL